MTSCQQEYYRKVAAPLEDQKEYENGQVWFKISLGIWWINIPPPKEILWLPKLPQFFTLLESME
jgi:hypothetical protein